jgi:hypothetical protein
VVEHLLNKCEALNSNLSTIKKKKKLASTEEGKHHCSQNVDPTGTEKGRVVRFRIHKSYTKKFKEIEDSTTN